MYTDDQIKTLLEITGLSTDDDRFAAHKDDYLSQLVLIQKNSDFDYGETPPSGSFNAAWD